MSRSLKSAGFCQFGGSTSAPDDAGVVLPPASGGCKVTVKYGSKIKTQKANGSGKDDAKITVTGKEVGSVKITVKWLDLGPFSDDVEASLLQLSPRGPNSGKPWAWTERFAGIHAAANVIVEDLEGPDPIEGTDEMQATITCSTWTKPTNSGAGTGSTPTDPQKWTGGNPVQNGPQGLHVGADGKVSPGAAPSAPSAKP
jgi:hypothetical protein